MGIIENPVRILVKRLYVAGLRIGEAANCHSSDTVGTLWILVLPCEVILRTSGENLDIMPQGHLFGYESTVVFGTPEDFCAVALNNKTYSHENLSTSCAKC